MGEIDFGVAWIKQSTSVTSEKFEVSLPGSRKINEVHDDVAEALQFGFKASFCDG